MSPNVKTASLTELSPVICECLEQNAEVILTITGNSMRPFLRHLRDQVVLTKCDVHSLRVGDVPLYRRANGQFVLHRIVGVGASTYTMCGDAQSQKEYGVPSNCILAVASGFYRKGKYISTQDKKYRCFVWLWSLLLPMRAYILRGGSLIKRAIRLLVPVRKKHEDA